MSANTETFKKIGGYLMIVGGTIFTAGFGMHFISRRIEKSDLKKETEEACSKISIEKAEQNAVLEQERKLAQIEKDREFTAKLKSMDPVAFARYRAEQTARANDDIMAKAEDIRREAESKVAKMKMEMTDTITKIREECSEKISKAEAKRDEAVEKYEAIDKLFTNKGKILEAKEKLEKIANAQQLQNQTKDDLIKSINNLF